LLKAYEVRFSSRSIAITLYGRIAISICWRRLYSAVYGFVLDVAVSCPSGASSST